MFTLHICICIKCQEWLQNPFSASAFASPLINAILNFNFVVDANAEVIRKQGFNCIDTFNFKTLCTIHTLLSLSVADTVVIAIPGGELSGMDTRIVSGLNWGSLRFRVTVISTTALALLGGVPPSTATTRSYEVKSSHDFDASTNTNIPNDGPSENFSIMQL